MAQKLNLANSYLTFNANKDFAESVLTTSWAAMTQGEQDTWLAASQFNTLSSTKDPTGWYHFIDYYMGIFGTSHQSNVSVYTTCTLSAGTTKNYADRATRTWTVA